MPSGKQWAFIVATTVLAALTTDASTLAGVAGGATVGLILGVGLVGFYNGWGKGDGTHQNPYASDDENYVGDE